MVILYECLRHTYTTIRYDGQDKLEEGEDNMSQELIRELTKDQLKTDLPDFNPGTQYVYTYVS